MNHRGSTRTRDGGSRVTNEATLRLYLYAFGIFSILVFAFPGPFLFSEALLSRNLPVEVMISSAYLALGVVMIGAARHPLKHKGLIDFIILASLFHAIIMIVFAQNYLHVVVDAIAVGLMGILPLLFYPWGRRKFLRE